MDKKEQTATHFGLAAIFGIGATLFHKKKQKGFKKKYKQPITLVLAGLSAYNGYKGAVGVAGSSTDSLSDGRPPETHYTDLTDGLYKGVMSGWEIFVEGRKYKAKTMGIRGRSPITATVKNGILTFKLDR